MSGPHYNNKCPRAKTGTRDAILYLFLMLSVHFDVERITRFWTWLMISITYCVPENTLKITVNENLRLMYFFSEENT